MNYFLDRSPKAKKQPKPLKRTPLKAKQTKIKAVSRKRAKQLRDYSTLRKRFLAENPVCGWWLKMRGQDFQHLEQRGGCYWSAGLEEYALLSCDIHHRNSRIGEKLNDTSDWIAVSRDGHNWIHSHPRDARVLGLLV